MRAHVMTSPAETADPLRNAGDAVDSAMLAVRQGAADADSRQARGPFAATANGTQS
ncbi:MAG: hypothetical protein ACLQGP_22325 [Isosphaeraceae bacterium]